MQKGLATPGEGGHSAHESTAAEFVSGLYILSRMGHTVFPTI